MDLRQDSCTRPILRHWSIKYIAIPFEPYNCASFVESILKKEFECDFVFPQTTLNRNMDIDLIKKTIIKLVKTKDPKEGDIVLMNGYREACHVGVYAEINNIPHVVHSEVSIKSGAVHRISDLPNYRYFLNGFYKWK